MKRKPTLEGSKVILRPFKQEDIQTMLTIISDPELQKLTGNAYSDEETHLPMKETEITRVKDWYQQINTKEDRLDLAIVYQDQVIGEVVLNEFEPELNACNFRVLMSKDARNQGLGTDAIHTFIKYAFEVLNLHRIELGVYSFNPRAIRVYQKVGFTLEGTKRKAHRFNNEWIDIHMMSYLLEDYKG